jgi:HAD superfamily, subfamily IIIB (Acid phosphatase)
MNRFSLALVVVLALAFPALAAADDTTIPPPEPILTHIGTTPLVELSDGGGGLPYLGSPTSYNAGDWENTLRAFHDTGVYDNELAQVDKLADAYVGRRGHGAVRAHGRSRRARIATFHGKRLALVLDIDETSLSNYSAINADNFTFGPNSQAEATNEIGVAIKPTLDLFNLAKKDGLAVFFITGRRENARAHTTSNLTREGYSAWTQLILKPDASTQTTVAYKSGARAAIEQQGYRIVANVGDQYSDLAGGHEDFAFKLPNPFYFLP